jgi:uncharacterized membrane protein
MYREAVRHGVASAIASVITAAIFVPGLVTGAIERDARLTSLAITLLFGLYGPLFLLLTWYTFRSMTGERLHAEVTRTEERNLVMRWLFLSSPISWAATVLVVGIGSVILVTSGEGAPGFWIIPICIIGVAGSWVLMVAVMAVEYIRSWANEDSMTFPGTDERGFTDFIYLSVQMSTTFSSADVEFTQRGIRGLASLHSVLAFAYSTAIIAVFASLLISLNT